MERSGEGNVPGAVLRFGRSCDHAATSFSSPSSLTCPDQFIDKSVDLPVMRQRTCTHRTNCAADRSDSPGVARGEHAATISSSSQRGVEEVPQAPFIDGVFAANRDRDATGAALGQVVQEF